MAQPAQPVYQAPVVFNQLPQAPGLQVRLCNLSALRVVRLVNVNTFFG